MTSNPHHTARRNGLAAKDEFKWPCMVCGRPTEPCAPLTICERCKDSPQAQIVRLEHKAWFWKERANHLSDTLDATEIYAETTPKQEALIAEVEAARFKVEMFTQIGGMVAQRSVLNVFDELLEHLRDKPSRSDEK